jgi:glutathione synthase/RimK-type ligase-like ATP-grasp enzyme
MQVHVFYENEAWMPPLREALAGRGLQVKEHFVDGGYVNIHKHPPNGVYINRMSPSAHTRGHQGGVVFVREILFQLEQLGHRVINGSSAFSLEVSKLHQHTAMEVFGIRTPRTIGVIGKQGLKHQARKMEFPFITKHNQGGKGLGVQLFQDYDSFDVYVDGADFIDSPDNVTLLQQYIKPRNEVVTRIEIVDGRFLYALSASTQQGFELCPADACWPADLLEREQPPPLFAADSSITADDKLVQKLIAFCKAYRLDVAGIEWVENDAGNRYVYDINGTSNYNANVEAKHGIHGMDAIADLVARELDAVS